MKNLRRVIITIITMMLLILPSLESRAEELTKMRTTAYCLQGTTYTGTQTREGICATGDKSLLGSVAVIYQRLPNDKKGKLIGIYSVEDTGCKKNVLDIWEPNLDKVQEFAEKTWADGCNGKVFVYFIKEGEKQ